MKIALPVTNTNQIDDHFGHCDYYSVYTINDKNKITEVQTIPSPQGCGCKSNIAGILAANGVSIMLAGGIGGGAINVLNNSGIEVVRGCSGDAYEVVTSYLAGKINDSGETCSHHGNGHDHICNN
jgi:predicted Fe-Mo cluster-binding NifX family protein